MIKYGDVLYFRLLDFRDKINYTGLDKLDLLMLDKLRSEVDINIRAIELAHRRSKITSEAMKLYKLEDGHYYLCKNEEPEDRWPCISYNKETGKPMYDSRYYQEDAAAYVYKPIKLIGATIEKQHIGDLYLLDKNLIDEVITSSDATSWDVTVSHSENEGEEKLTITNYLAW